MSRYIVTLHVNIIVEAESARAAEEKAFQEAQIMRALPFGAWVVQARTVSEATP